MKLSDIRVRWFDVVFFVGFPGVWNYLFGLDGITYFPSWLVMLSYVWFMQKRGQSHSDSGPDAGSSPDTESS